MQVRVPWTQAWLCTKDFCRKCTGAGVAAKVAVPSNAVYRGEARTYLHQTWTEESLDCGGLGQSCWIRGTSLVVLRGDPRDR
ncbi:hypothetical protein NDU88_009561 [Pleurodeles waltl]|uniref:Uncharacterized protein n=1 Tax=Pleurodeles waltl TaxID=8319 RepID=A0AAV7QTC4_PLEWA|nr:hypothetical protein NDU88_009561 [Pleurodeles waltl]